MEGQEGDGGEWSTKEMSLERTGARLHRAVYVALGNLDLVLWAVAA